MNFNRNEWLQEWRMGKQRSRVFKVIIPQEVFMEFEIALDSIGKRDQITILC